MEFVVSASLGVTIRDGGLRVIKNPHVLVEGNTILEIISNREPPSTPQGAERLHGGKVSILLPTFINTHTHAAMTLLRGLSDDVPLFDWLQNIIWPTEKHLTEKHVYAGAKLAALEAMLSGTGLLNSHYFMPHAEAKAFQEVGIRGIVGDPIIEVNGSQKLNTELFSKYHQSYNDLIRVAFAPHAPYTVTQETFHKIRDEQATFNSKNPSAPALMHVHLSETRDEMQLIKNFTESKGERVPSEITTPVQYMDWLSALNDSSICAHLVWASDQDREILKKRGVGISINLQSNLKLGSGIPPVLYYVREKQKVSLGTDGASSNNTLNMFETLRLLPLLYKGTSLNPTVLPIKTTLGLATIGGAKALKWNGLGELKAGALADFMVVELNHPSVYPVGNETAAISHLLYANSGIKVKHVIINGNLVVENFAPTKVNSAQVLEEAQRASQDLLDKANIPTRTW